MFNEEAVEVAIESKMHFWLNHHRSFIAERALEATDLAVCVGQSIPELAEMHFDQLLNTVKWIATRSDTLFSVIDGRVLIEYQSVLLDPSGRSTSRTEIADVDLDETDLEHESTKARRPRRARKGRAPASRRSGTMSSVESFSASGPSQQLTQSLAAFWAKCEDVFEPLDAEYFYKRFEGLVLSAYNSSVPSEQLDEANSVLENVADEFEMAEEDEIAVRIAGGTVLNIAMAELLS